MLIICYRFGAWWAEVANTPIAYQFAGASVWDQAVNVRAFADSLADGNIGVYQFFEEGSVPPGVIEQQLFSDNTIVAFEQIERDIGEALIDNLEEVGEFLIACIG